MKGSVLKRVKRRAPIETINIFNQSNPFMRSTVILAFLVFVFITAALEPGNCHGQTYADSINDYRDKYRQEFLTEERSPIHDEENLRLMQFYLPDESYRIVAAFTKAMNEKPFELPTMNGKTKPYILYGTIRFDVLGKPCSLNLYQSVRYMNTPEYDGELFLPFTDETNDEETYINGRYLNLNMNDIVDGKMVVDFNLCYNPYCAYSSGYSCPRPPEENRLGVRIEAGEKKYLGKYH